MRIFVFKRSRWTAAGCLLLAAAMFWVVSHPSVVGAAGAVRSLPIYYVEPSGTEKRVAISFDAAWGNEDTEELISILSKYNVKATFFLVGTWVEKYPDSTKALADAGHEIGNHSENHPYFTQCPTDHVREQVTACNEAVKRVTGTEPTLIRVPYGDYNTAVVDTIRSMGMEPIQWNVDSLDWKGISADEITQNVLNKVCDGSIVLFHNAADHTPEALPTILEHLLADGYTFYTISDLILDGEYNVDYTIDNNGMQCSVSNGTATAA